MTAQAANNLADAGFVLAKATARASGWLGLSNAELSRVIGVSQPTISRVRQGQKALTPNRKTGQLALLLVRVYRSLDALAGGDVAYCKQWMHSYNYDLRGVPAALIQNPQGLVQVLSYLDGMRAVA